MLLKARKYSSIDFRSESHNKLRARRRPAITGGDESEAGISGGVQQLRGLSQLLEEDEPAVEGDKPTGKKRRVSFIMPHSGDMIQVQPKPFNSWGTQTAEYNSICMEVMSESYYVNAISALQQRLQMYQLMAEDVSDLMTRRQRLHRLRRDRQQLESAWRNVFAIISFVTSVCLLVLALRLSVKLAWEVLVD